MPIGIKLLPAVPAVFRHGTEAGRLEHQQRARARSPGKMHRDGPGSLLILVDDEHMHFASGAGSGGKSRDVGTGFNGSRQQVLAEKTRLIPHELTAHLEPTMDEPTTFRDERLELIFTCCHPALAMEARVALTLKVVAGLSTAEVARM